MIIYHGPSRIGRGSVVCIATGLDRPSTNRKTGDVLQVWILSATRHPLAALRKPNSKRATSHCGRCPLQSNGCYVNVGRAPAQIYRAWRAGRYPELDVSAFDGKQIRLGAYGDPAAIPAHLIDTISRRAKSIVGYSHSLPVLHHTQAKQLSRWLMCSTHDEASRIWAESRGYRVFHVSPEKPSGFLTCLNSSHGLQCDKCGACNGNKGRSIWIAPHGTSKAKIS